MKQVRIYTDGSCIGNPGPGGWALIMEYQKGRPFVKTGCDWQTTSARMEAQAALEGLKLAVLLGHPENIDVVIYADSQYVTRTITEKKIEDFTMSSKYKNADLWAAIFRRVPQFHSVRAEWIQGHSGHMQNEQADKLARNEARICNSERDLRLFVFGELLRDPKQQAGKLLFKSGCKYSMGQIQKYIDLYKAKSAPGL